MMDTDGRDLAPHVYSKQDILNLSHLYDVKLRDVVDAMNRINIEGDDQ